MQGPALPPTNKDTIACEHFTGRIELHDNDRVRNAHCKESAKTAKGSRTRGKMLKKALFQWHTANKIFSCPAFELFTAPAILRPIFVCTAPSFCKRPAPLLAPSSIESSTPCFLTQLYPLHLLPGVGSGSLLAGELLASSITLLVADGVLEALGVALGICE
jgi:hypothetical protein